MIKLILRYDDFCAISNTDLELKILEVIAAHGAKVIMSVVPFVAEIDWDLRGPIPLRPLTAEKASLLKEFVPTHAEIALHGYSHQTVTRWSHLFEFGDRVSQQRQTARLRDGRAFLEDIFAVEVNAFVPPWNEYGQTTLSALAEAGFSVVAGDLALGPLDGNLAFVPASCDLSALEGALAAANSDPDAAVSVLIHEYDFKEAGWTRWNTDLATFERFLAGTEKNRIQWAGFSDCSPRCDWNGARVAANRRLRAALASPARRFLPRKTADVYWSPAYAEKKTAFLNAANPRGWLRRLTGTRPCESRTQPSANHR